MLASYPCLRAQNDGQDPDKLQKELNRREEDAIRRSVERSQRPVETERDKLLDELVKIPGPALSKDNFDPWFDSLSGGGDTWQVDGNAPKTFREMHKRIAKHVGTNDTITRAQFKEYAKVNLQEKNSPPWRPPENSPESDAERAFREGDKDRTRRLEESEMSETLRSNLSKWDRDGDGKIDLEEYTAYYLARMAEVPAKAEASAVTGKPMATPTTPPSPFDDERPPVLRYGKLPKGLPTWFVDWDTDQDGQIGLYEWRKAGQSIEEFTKFDLNGDGFIEASEWFKWSKENKENSPAISSTSVGRKQER
jgi:Ca2+-binding EF-hand superfamily protein